MQLALIFLLMISEIISGTHKIDLTIVNGVRNDTQYKFTGFWIDNLCDLIKVNILPLFIDKNDMSPQVAAVLNNSDTTPGNVAVLLDVLWHKDSCPADSMPRGSKIKLSFTTFEATKLPKQWVEILNRKFDAAVVPDDVIRKIYENSGVRIPIFELPFGFSMDDLLERSNRLKPSSKLKTDNIFTFGMSGAFWPRKNHRLLYTAFKEEFGNDPKVRLVLHSRLNISNDFLTEIRNDNLKNVKVIAKWFSNDEYVKFLVNLNCYVLVSAGEGYSLSPREALALNIPCILSDNFAHKTLCRTGFVRAVKAEIPIKADYSIFFGPGGDYGDQYNCDITEIRKALRDVYDNYAEYKEKTMKAKLFIEQENFGNLKLKYLNLVKPKKVILGPKNIVTEEYIMTKSLKLYRKYQSII